MGDGYWLLLGVFGDVRVDRVNEENDCSVHLVRGTVGKFLVNIRL
jgi:hypothetical protein